MKSDRDRLNEFLETGDAVEFFLTSDKEYGGLRWGVYGAPPTNEVFVLADANGRIFVSAAPSILLFPPMSDRKFGIDIADQFVAEKLSAEIWSANREEILSALGKL